VGVVPPAAPPTSSGANTVRPQPRPGAGQDNLPEGVEDGWRISLPALVAVGDDGPDELEALPPVPSVVHSDYEPVPGEFRAAVLALWPADQQGTAACVAERESTWRPDAVNGEHRGLYQINVVVHAERIARLGYTADDMLLAYPNAVVAHDIWASDGWDGPWRAQRGICW